METRGIILCYPLDSTSFQKTFSIDPRKPSIFYRTFSDQSDSLLLHTSKGVTEGGDVSLFGLSRTGNLWVGGGVNAENLKTMKQKKKKKSVG